MLKQLKHCQLWARVEDTGESMLCFCTFVREAQLQKNSGDLSAVILRFFYSFLIVPLRCWNLKTCTYNFSIIFVLKCSDWYRCVIPFPVPCLWTHIASRLLILTKWVTGSKDVAGCSFLVNIESLWSSWQLFCQSEFLSATSLFHTLVTFGRKCSTDVLAHVIFFAKMYFCPSGRARWNLLPRSNMTDTTTEDSYPKYALQHSFSNTVQPRF